MKTGQSFKAKLPKTFATKEEAYKFLESNAAATFKVADLEKKPAKKSPAAPFTTSTLQQEASTKIIFFCKQNHDLWHNACMKSGLITYMRTDSVNLSDEARKGAQKEIESAFGSKYSKPRNYTGKSKGAQEAHEAIRPTDFSLHSVDIDRDQARLYDLIWKRAIASQMSEAELERTNVKISASTHKELFTANGEVITFDGFLKVYLEGRMMKMQNKKVCCQP